MTFILRWPSVLVLFALVALSWLAAGVVAAALLDLTVAPQMQEAAAEAGVAQHGWLDVGLWAGAGIFFLISGVRLIRRTQGFWTWLLGFALYGGRWAWAQQQAEGGVVATVQSIDINAYRQPAQLAQQLEGAEAQIGILGVVLIVGLFIFIVDAADRAYWDRQGA